MIRTVVVRIVCLFELAVVQGGIGAVLFQQFFVTALFDDVSMVHEQDGVGIAVSSWRCPADRAEASLSSMVS